MVASVPELTSRTCSTGARAMISSASSTSPGVAAPNDVPRASASDTAAGHRRVRVPEDHRPPGADEVHVLMAVHVESGTARPRAR